MSAKILVVDDVELNVKLLSLKLTNEYYDVIEARDGNEAVAAAEKQLPDIILMDAMMPNLNGFDAVKKIKSNPNLAHIPIIMITALNNRQDKIKALECGAEDFISKPINEKVMLTRIKALLRIKMLVDELRLRDQVGVQNGLMSKSAFIEEQSYKGVQALLVDDDVVQINRIKSAFETIGIQTTVCQDKDQALQAISGNQYTLVLLNSQLFNSDVLRLCSNFKSNESLRNVPIILMIDESEEVMLTKALEIGINDYVPMPLDTNELIARCKTQIKHKKYHDLLRNYYTESILMAMVDPLTNLYNRRYLDMHLLALSKDYNSAHRSLAIMMLDLDHFKSVNDKYGHQAGDEILKEFGVRIKDTVRATDLCARYGGEEFIVIMPEVNKVLARRIAERLRVNIASVPFDISVMPKQIQCTVSIGIAFLLVDDTPSSIIGRADSALYKAKERNRNVVVMEDELDD